MPVTILTNERRVLGVLTNERRVLPVVLEVGQARVHREGGADAAQAAQGEVVVEDQRLLRVVETLDILTRLGVVGAPVTVMTNERRASIVLTNESPVL